jgi:hypothetical protein
MNKDANIPEDDWKKRWKPGTYGYLAPGYEPGTHEVERGEVTWHEMTAEGNVSHPSEDIARQDQAPPQESAK